MKAKKYSIRWNDNIVHEFKKPEEVEQAIKKDFAATGENRIAEIWAVTRAGKHIEMSVEWSARLTD